MDEQNQNNQPYSSNGAIAPNQFVSQPANNQTQPLQQPQNNFQAQQPMAPQPQQPQQYAPQPPGPVSQVPLQQPQQYAQATAQPQPSNLAYPQSTGFQSSQDMQNTIRNKILKIIFILSAISLAIVGLVYLLNSSSDATLSTTTEVSNAQATFAVPAAWGSTETEDYSAFFNQESLEASQATMVVIKPVRVSFDTNIITDGERRAIAEDYKRTVNEGESNIRLGARSDVAIDGFVNGYDYVIEGQGENGTTELRGISRVLFDEQNFAHTIEFVAVQSYWTVNEQQILEILNSYQRKTLE